VLKSGGSLLMRVSYNVGLNELSLRVLSSDSIRQKEGFTIGAELDLPRMPEAAPALSCPEPQD